MERGKRVQFLVTFSVSLATLTMGVSSAWPTIVIPLFHKNATDIRVTDDVASWMIAITPIGFTSGSLLTRDLSDKFGRRAVVLSSAAPFAFGTLFVILAFRGWMLYITKFLWGFGTGMLSTVITMYLVEISYKELRATLSAVTRFMFNFGSLLVMCVGPFLPYEVLNYSLLTLPLVYFAACWWIPESPYYHLKEGRIDIARKELSKLRNIDADALEDELGTMRNATGLKVAQILTGGMAIQQYLIVIVEESGFKMAEATISIVYGAVMFAVALLSSVLVDRVGRRPLLIHSFLGTGVSFAAVGTYFLLLEVIRVDHEVLSPYGAVTFVSIIMSTIFSNLGFNSVAGVVTAEIFPMNVKAVAMTSLNVLGGLLGFTVARGYQLVKDSLGLSGVFFLFAAVTLCGAAFTHLCVPETRGKSLVEIQVMLQAPPIVTAQCQTDGATNRIWKGMSSWRN
ncbi:unnamed protein product, partial [Iphiclides podalirius]